MNGSESQEQKSEETSKQKDESGSKPPPPRWSWSWSADLLRAVTGFFWMVIAAAFVFILLRPVLPALLSHLDSIAIGPEWAHIELSFRGLTEASPNVGSAEHSPAPLTEAELKPLQARAIQVAAKITGRRILWVDNRIPDKEYAALTSVGFTLDVVNSTEAALARLDQQGYDLMVTNMRRKEDEFAGVTLLNAMCQRHIYVPGIIYSWGFDPATGVPINAAHAQNRAELLQLVFDAAELGFPKARCEPNFCTTGSTDPACVPEVRLAPHVPDRASAFTYASGPTAIAATASQARAWAPASGPAPASHPRVWAPATSAATASQGYASAPQE
ncbi:hypothetical protein AB4Y45_33925 [Paraburkholderia sp. EG287A]|uniref:hypothetical protein n=1 Tax=Paraburkholderia sp. EG287A TaxID=3237012 RepID=UPI0034D1EFD3